MGVMMKSKSGLGLCVADFFWSGCVVAVSMYVCADWCCCPMVLLACWWFGGLVIGGACGVGGVCGWSTGQFPLF